jgi:AcrR family transcriptional regulator
MPAEGRLATEPRKAALAGSDIPPLDSAKRKQIMEGARRVFLEQGFDGASIGDIVRAAGISRGTLYAYFPSKEKLFEALVFETRRMQAEVLFVLDEASEDASAVLNKLGVTFLEMLLRPDTLAFLRAVIGASCKFPEVGRAFYDAGPRYGVERLARYLRRLTERGALNVPEPELAAQQYLDLCKSSYCLPMLLGYSVAPSRSEIEAAIAKATATFLAAYAPRAERTGA